MVALTKQGLVDPEISLAILLELRAQLSTIGQLLKSRRMASEPPRHSITADR